MRSCIRPTIRTIRAYNGGKIDLVGETQIHVCYNNRVVLHNFLVVAGQKVNLLGRDLFQKLNISIVLPDSNIANVSSNVLDDFKSYFSPNYVSCVQQKVKLDVSPSAIPTYSKARTVTLKMKDKVKCELQRLVDAGTITKIFSSKWASPIVCVLKKDGSLRICGDFSATLNKFLRPVQTP